MREQFAIHIINVKVFMFTTKFKLNLLKLNYVLTVIKGHQISQTLNQD